MKLTDADNAADGIFFPALEQNMMGAVLINENDEVMFFNPAAEKLWGYKREEVIGNNIDMLIPRDLRPAHPEYIRHNREGGKARVEGMSRELQLEKKDGSKIWTRFALSKVSAEGKVYYLALVRDASVEMAQKEQTRQLIIAVDHLDRPVIVLDPERHIVQCNRAFTEMFGYCISEASGMQPDTLLNIPEFPADNRIRLQQLLWKTARDQDEFLLLTRTGEKIWIKASISPVYDVLAHLQNLVMTFSDITEERQIRQLEGNILAAMCSSPPFHEMGEIICRNIESVLNESHVSLFALRNGMPIHWASSSHGAEVQNAQSWSATIRQRDGAPAGILQIKTSSGAETSAFIERVADISQHMAALALEQEKSRQHIEQLIQFDPMTGLPNRNNLHNYLDDLVDKAVSPVVYLIGVDHIQDVIDSLGYAWADQALLEVVNRFREKLKPDQYLCRIEGTQFVLVSLENDVSNITQIADELRNVVSKPIMIDNKPFPLTLSIGIKQLRQWRGARVAMIFQEPMTALNPTRRIGLQMMDVIRHHQPISRREARAKAIALLEEMQIPDAVEVMSRYPFELSGGMRQRVMIALAFSCEPQLIIADEPTTALDVTVQLQVLRLLKHKARASGTAVLFISHDMAVVSQLCDSVYVMYAGSVIESGVTADVIHHPRHPYTIGLLQCAPEHGVPRQLLPAIPGTVPNLTHLPDGCAFRDRCYAAGAQCENVPALTACGDNNQRCACWYPQQEVISV
ncbi:TPA: oxygen-sensing cyclic-di-GMP phosphodiesterase [Escherichia coli]|nr:oxygen-sensing cyclic-di-GMP phosphodiesterase [Escherichia coli]